MNGSSLRGVLTSARRWLRNRLPLSYGMRGTAPMNPSFGAGEGTPIDRYYIERFLASQRSHISGAVLEIGDRSYTEHFGENVTSSAVLSAVSGAGVDFVGDLASCPEIPDNSFDCVLLVQTLHYLYDMEAGVAELARILKPGGCVLCTVPGISQVSRYDMVRWGDRWRLTSLSAAELFATTFDPTRVDVSAFGNALSAVSFLQGVPAERIKSAKLDVREPDYELVVCVIAAKKGSGA
jgi:SAM-dependent methyltransferase